MKIKYIQIVFLFSSFSFLFSLAPSAQAADFSVGIYPPLLRIESQPPAEILAPFTVQNNSHTDSIDLDFQFVPFTASQRFDGQVSLAPVGTQYTQKYISLFQNTNVLDGQESITKITLAPLEQKQLQLSIHVPVGMENGDYYFTILAKSRPTFLDQSSATSIVGQIGTNIILSVGDKEKPSGVIQDFSTPLFFFHGPVPINLLVENTSNNVETTQGVVVIKNMFNQPIGSLTLVPVNILAHSSRFIPSDQSNTTSQIIWPEANIFGIYSAEISIAISPQGPLFTRTIYFFAAPVQFVIILAILVFFITFIVLKIHSALKNQNSLNN